MGRPQYITGSFNHLAFSSLERGAVIRKRVASVAVQPPEVTLYVAASASSTTSGVIPCGLGGLAVAELIARRAARGALQLGTGCDVT